MRWRTRASLFATLLLPAMIGAAQQSPDAPEQPIDLTVPYRALTAGPKAHWFGYYDKHEFDPTGRYVLGMEVDFQGRTPNANDKVRLGMIDTQNGDAWIDIGESRAWSWQQGCMLQWLPGSSNEVIYNDRDGGRYIAVIKNVFTGESRTIPHPVYTVSADGKTGMSVPFARIDETRPGYGYKGVVDPYAADPHPAEDGIRRVDLVTGEAELVISIDQIAAIPAPKDPLGKHWFNHLLFNPTGDRFIFLHRAFWEAGGKTWSTRMFTARPDGSDLYCLADHGMVSHFIWKNPTQILAWAREPATNDHFYLYTDQTDTIEMIGDGVLPTDGHCTYSPDGQWILTDTYPNKERLMKLMLLRVADSALVPLGTFFHPREHSGEFRCDLHPRWDRVGKYICVDSICTGYRQIYLIDVSGITGA
ncbi:MAG: hypothetical protein IT364_14255 [Candidatus Hydrogenedentes bacterium]|nr:hypothetical protein [Candidatus Hydrogenedentota bacterium]